MKTFFALLLFYSIQLSFVYSLECYVTDFASLEVNNADVPTRKNCDTFFEEISKTKLNSDLASGLEYDLRCFAVRIKSEKTNIAIQGCTPEDGCDKIINELRLKNWILGETITCRECSGDLCNEDVRAVKTSSETKTYLILTVVMIMVFMCAISVMLRIFSKKSGGGEKKYSQLRV